jgi:hypothetical protein
MDGGAQSGAARGGGMKPNHLMILGAAFFGLVAFLAFCGPDDGPTNQLATGSVRVAKFNTSAPDRLTISQGDKELVALTKSGATWHLASGHPADLKKVDELIQDLAALKADIRPARAGKLATYGLAKTDVTTRIDVFAGEKVLAAVTLGKKGPDWGTAFTKRADHDEVLLTSEGPVGRLVSGEIKPSAMIERHPGKLDPSAVTEMTIGGSVNRVLTKFQAPEVEGETPAPVWTAADQKPVASEAAEALLKYLGTLYIRDPVALPAGAPAAVISLTGAGFAKIGFFAGDGDVRTLVIDEMAYTIGKASITTFEEKLAALSGS